MMKIAQTGRHRNDVEAPSFGAPPLKSFHDSIFEDDVIAENAQRSRQRVRSRLSSMILTMLTLAAVGFGAYFFFVKDGTLPGAEVSSPLLGSNIGNSSSPVDSSETLQIAKTTVQMHAVPNDCWLIYYDRVYDMTDYAPTHPASPIFITSQCGKDATAAYASVHSQSLLATVDKYLLGTLQGADPSPIPRESGEESFDSSDEDENIFLPAPTRRPNPAPTRGPALPPISGPTRPPTVPPTSTPVSVPTAGEIAMATVQQHAVPEDCWLVYYDSVYDMTQYALTHPASSTLITRHCGKDATTAYAAVHDSFLLVIVEEYLLGALAAAVPTNPPVPAPTKAPNKSPTHAPVPGPTRPPTPNPTNAPTPEPTPNPTKSPTSPPAAAPTVDITMATVQQHAVPEDCWLVYYGNVYDMTQYAPTHPAPSTLITRHCGQDATTAYAAIHDRSLLVIVEEYLLEALATTQGPSPTQGPTRPPTSPPVATPTPGEIAMATVQQHASPNDCWLVYYDDVYDMTQYAPTHPAAPTLITRHCGRDATAAYSSVHRQSLLSMVSRYRLGALQGGSSNGGSSGNTGGSGSSGGSVISMATVQMHSTPGDCWLVYYDKVYDMTHYAPNHPASSTLITRHCGRDATMAYASEHRRSLLAMVDGYVLGAFEGADPSSFPPDNANDSDDSSEEDCEYPS